MPRIGVIGIIAFGVLIALISSFEPPREGQMSSTEYIGAIAFLALLFYFITNSRDDVEESNKPNRIIIQRPYKKTKRKKKKKKKKRKKTRN